MKTIDSLEDAGSLKNGCSWGYNDKSKPLGSLKNKYTFPATYAGILTKLQHCYKGAFAFGVEGGYLTGGK